MALRLRRAAKLCTLGLVLFLSIHTSYADPIKLKLTSGASTQEVIDSGSGVVTYSGNVGQWTINVTTGQGSLALGNGYLDLNTTNTAAQGATNDLTIYFTETSLSGPVNNWLVTIGGTNSNTSFVYDAFADALNRAYYTGAGAFIGELASSDANFSLQTTGARSVGTSGLYSLTERIVVHPTSPNLRNQFGGNADIDPLPNPLPEPSSLILLGAGLLGVGIFRRGSKFGLKKEE